MDPLRLQAIYDAIEKYDDRIPDDEATYEPFGQFHHNSLFFNYSIDATEIAEQYLRTNFPEDLSFQQPYCLKYRSQEAWERIGCENQKLADFKTSSLLVSVAERIIPTHFCPLDLLTEEQLRDYPEIRRDGRAFTKYAFYNSNVPSFYGVLEMGDDMQYHNVLKTLYSLAKSSGTLKNGQKLVFLENGNRLESRASHPITYNWYRHDFQQYPDLYRILFSRSISNPVNYLFQDQDMRFDFEKMYRKKCLDPKLYERIADIYVTSFDVSEVWEYYTCRDNFLLFNRFYMSVKVAKETNEDVKLFFVRTP